MTKTNSLELLLLLLVQLLVQQSVVIVPVQKRSKVACGLLAHVFLKLMLMFKANLHVFPRQSYD